MKKMLNFGMVGCGEISVANLGAIRNLDNTSVVMVMDHNEELALSLAEMADCRATMDFNEILTAKEVEAVCFSTPHDLHACMGIQAAEAGKHIVMEKPLANTLEDAHRLIQACQEHGVKLSVPYIYRYNYNIIKARELVRGGAIGKIIAVEIHWISEKPESYWMTGFTGRGGQSGWRKSKQRSGGGVMMMNCIHFFDYIDYISGLIPIKYYSQYDTFLTDVKVEDYFVGTVRFSNGALGSILAGSKMVGGRYPDELRGVRFYGEQGQIVIGDPGPLWLYSAESTSDSQAGEWTAVTPALELEARPQEQPVDSPRTRFMRDFVEAVLEDREPPISGEDAYRSLETVLRLYESTNSD